MSYQHIRFIIITIALGIVALILWNTNVFFDQFKTIERDKMEVWAAAQTEFLSTSNTIDQSPLILQIFQSNKETPMILVNKDHSVFVNNMDHEILNDSIALVKKIDFFKSQNQPIVLSHSGTYLATLYYGDAELLNKLKFYPLGLVLILILFTAIFYFYMKSEKVSEQNKLWAGMTKETAHQIATPLTAIIGWNNLLKSKGIEPNITEELDSDIDRLSVITSRFAKVGAVPTLELVPFHQSTKEGLAYLQKRIPGTINIVFKPSKEEEIALNKPLYFWCLENIVKNAVDAMQGDGTIELSFDSDQLWSKLYIKDSGPGISQKKVNSIFKPGISSKKRGWGLGLSLAKRIIEEYHKGKISVFETSSKGTTFELKFRKGQF